MPTLSIVIPTHRRPAVLRQCLEHLRQQTVREQLEVIVVSDGHDAQTAGLCEQVVSGIRYFEVEKSQQGVARNRGVMEARGEYVLFIGDDIFLAADACEKHLRRLKTPHSAQPSSRLRSASEATRGRQDSGLVAVLGHTTWDPAVGTTPVMHWLERTGWQFGYPMLKPYAHRFIPADIQHRFTYTSHVSLPTSVARAHPFERTNLYGWEDTEWGRRLAEAGIRLFYEPDAKAWHHHRIELEDSLRRMETLGRSIGLIAKHSPSFDRMPRGWKRTLYHALALLPTMRGKHAKAFLRGLRT